MAAKRQKTKDGRPAAVISGATQGIGKAIAERLLEQGFDVALCARSERDLLRIKHIWKAKYLEATIVAIAVDFANPAGVAAFAATVEAAFPAIHILVNNAGIFQPGDIATEPEGQLEAMMQVNLFSAYQLTRLLLPRMHAGSHIFNMCSVASLKAYPAGGSYSITKYALLGFSDNLRYELKPRGVRVTAICPGATWSRSWSSSGVDEARIMEAADIAKMVWAAYTLSPQAVAETIVLRPQLGDL